MYTVYLGTGKRDKATGAQLQPFYIFQLIYLFQYIYLGLCGNFV